MSERTLSEIRDASNNAWVLGSDRFRAQIEAQQGVGLCHWPGEGIENLKNIEGTKINDSDPIDLGIYAQGCLTMKSCAISFGHELRHTNIDNHGMDDLEKIPGDYYSKPNERDAEDYGKWLQKTYF